MESLNHCKFILSNIQEMLPASLRFSAKCIRVIFDIKGNKENRTFQRHPQEQENFLR